VSISVALTSAFAGALAPDQLLDALGRAGSAGLVLHAGLDPARYEALERELRRLPILAVEAPCPADRSSTAALASVDREEAKVALEAAEATLRRAGALAARFVVVRLGALRAADGEWTTARQKFLRGDLDERLTRRLVESRDQKAERALDVARRQLDRLSRTAESAGLTLAVAQPRRFTDLPSPREIDFLLRDLSGAPIGPLFDSAAAHLPDLMHAWPMAVSAAAFGPGPLHYLGDACGPIGGLAPGHGILETSFLKGLRKDAEVAFRPWQGLTADEAVAALPAVEKWAALRGS
jgi:hypothetical protein